MHHLLSDIGVAVLAATLFGLVAHWLRQPVLLGYLLAGAAVGPQLGLGLVRDGENIETIAEIGLVLLLFVIGLELNVKEVLAAGRQLLVVGFGQFLACAALGLLAFGACGYGLSGTSSEGLYLALTCGLSSTAIVVKLLYDKRELDTLPGRLTIGVLVIQDVYAIFVLAFQPNLAHPSPLPILRALAGSAALVAGGFLVSRYVLTRVFASVAKSPEAVLAASLGWCAAVAAAASALGLSKEMGALIAGLSVSAFPYSVHVTAKALPLRDFFLTLFFVSLGMKIVAPTWAMVGPVVGIVGFVIASRFLSVYPLLALSGAGRRAAFVTSLNLAQVSEFSLVIVTLGVQFGHVRPELVALTIYAMAVTAVLSSYAIRYSHPLFLLADRLLTRSRAASSTTAFPTERDGAAADVVLLGYHRGARALVEAAEARCPELLARLRVIDFNPASLAELKARGVRAMFGDVSSLDVLSHAHLGHAGAVVSTIPDMLLKGVDNARLVRMARDLAPHAVIVATADDAEHERRLRRVGADVVLRPFEAAARELLEHLAAGNESSRSGDAAQHPHGATAA
jgi:Kef-type K+ transport system membrane component KefB